MTFDKAAYLERTRQSVLIGIENQRRKIVRGEVRDPRDERKRTKRVAPIDNPYEATEQKRVLHWLKHVARLGPTDYAANTDGAYYGDKVRGAIQRSLGARKGRPDIEVFAIPPNAPGCRGIGIEVKRRKGGKVGDEQKEWHAQLTRNGWLVVVGHADKVIGWLGELGFGQ
jgi:hypothetical protein